MTKVFADKKPSVSSTTWSRIFHDSGLSVYESDKYECFYKVVPQNERPKYFFGESAWSNSQRFAVDKIGLTGYNIFS